MVPRGGIEPPTLRFSGGALRIAGQALTARLMCLTGLVLPGICLTTQKFVFESKWLREERSPLSKECDTNRGVSLRIAGV